MFKDLVAKVWRQKPFPHPPERGLGPELVAQLSQKSEFFDGMPAGAIYLALTYWTRLYGLICMEVFGQLHWALDDAGAYFEAQLFEIGEALGLDCPLGLTKRCRNKRDPRALPGTRPGGRTLGQADLPDCPRVRWRR